MVHKRKDGKIDEKDEARTPPSLFKKLDDIYHFDCDAAATDRNNLCEQYFGEDYTGVKEDALKFDWLNCSFQDGLTIRYPKTFYCNPPYSNPAPFIKKAYEESLKGAIVVMLLPMDSGTKAFHEYCMKAYKWIIFKPRVKFLKPDGTPMEGSPKFGSFACVFDEKAHDESSAVYCHYPIVESMEWK